MMYFIKRECELRRLFAVINNFVANMFLMNFTSDSTSNLSSIPDTFHLEHPPIFSKRSLQRQINESCKM